MLNIELSKLPYGQTLGHIGNVLVGTVFLAGVVFYEPRFHVVRTEIHTATASTLAVAGILSLVIAYVAGQLVAVAINLPLGFIWNLGQRYARNHRRAQSAEQSLPEPWKNIAVAVLSRVGVQQPEKSDWTHWTNVFYGAFVEEGMSIQAIKYYVTFAVGVVLVGFMVLYEDARILPLEIASAVAIPSVVYRIWNLGRTYAEFESSWSDQAVGMLQFLLDTVKSEQDEEGKAVGKAAGH